MESAPESLLLIAGRGKYPELVLLEARKAGVRKIVVIAFEGETSPELAAAADEARWMRVGQFGKFLSAARESGARHALMAGQIAPSHLFDLRPDLKALVLLAKLPVRNAESLFGEVARQLESVGVTLLPATTFLEAHLAPAGLIAGNKPKARVVEDMRFGYRIARATSSLDIGQSVVVRNGTVLAVEAFEGTDECMRRGGALGKGGAILVKVSKPGQDMRFDVPVVGERTLAVARESGIAAIAVEAGRTLLLDRPAVENVCKGIILYGLREEAA